MFKYENKLPALSKPSVEGKTYTQETKDRKGHSGSITAIAVNNSGNKLVSGSSDNSIKIWDINKGKVVHTFHVLPSDSRDGYVRSVAFSSTGHFASAANTNERNTIIWRDWKETGDQSPSDISEMNSRSLCVAFSPQGFLIVKGTEDGLVEIWETNLVYKQGKGQRFWAEDARFKGSKLKTRLSDPSLEKTGELTTVKVKASHSNRVMSVTFSPDGNRIASGSADGTIKIWDVFSGALLHVLKGEGTVNSVEFNSDGTQVVCGVGDLNSKYKGDGTPAYSNCEARIWDIGKKKILHRISHVGVVTSAKFNHDKTEPVVISGSTDGIIKISSIEKGKLLQTLDHKESSVTSIAYSPENKRIFAGLDDGSINIWVRSYDNTGIYTALLSMKQIDKEIIAQYLTKKEKDIRKQLEKDARKARTTVRARSAERSKSANSKSTRRVRSAELLKNTSPTNLPVAAGPENKAPTTKGPLEGKLFADNIEYKDLRNEIFKFATEPASKTPSKKGKTPAHKENAPAHKEKTPESEYEIDSD